MRFCQPCLSWVCVERCWPGDHINQCWDCLPQRPQPMPNPKPKPKPARVKQDIEEAEATNRWCIFTREMMRFQRTYRLTYWRLAYRQIEDKRIDDGPRSVPPNGWPDVRAPPPNLWDYYNEDAVWGESPLGVPESPRHPIGHDLYSIGESSSRAGTSIPPAVHGEGRDPRLDLPGSCLVKGPYPPDAKTLDLTQPPGPPSEGARIANSQPPLNVI